MARLYSNENFPLPVVARLRQLGHDVLTVQETGKGGQGMTDREVLEFARAQDRVLLTLNRKHFIRLHEVYPEHRGIIVCTFDPEFARQGWRIHQLIAAEPSLAGKRVRVNRPQG